MLRLRERQQKNRTTQLRSTRSRDSRLSKRLYTISELISLTGMTRKQVAYWAHKELLSPTMRDPMARAGRPASFYSAKEIVKALIICDLKQAGFSLRKVQQVANNLEQHGIKLDQSKDYLVTNGSSVYYADSDIKAFDILKHHRQMLLLVPIHEQVKKLTRTA